MNSLLPIQREFPKSLLNFGLFAKAVMPVGIAKDMTTEPFQIRGYFGLTDGTTVLAILFTSPAC